MIQPQSTKTLKIILALLFIAMNLIISFKISAEFKSSFPCSDATRVCIEGKRTKKIDGCDVTKECWKYKYVKTCRVPSKDNCGNLSKSHKCHYRDPSKVDYSDPEVRSRQSGEVTEHCMVHDYYHNCLNMYKQFVCKEAANISVDVKEVKFNPNKKNAAKKFTCLAETVSVKNNRDGSMMARILSKLTSAHKMSEG
jgi:hypothetical protein